MKFAAKRIAENLLFAADIFILFLVLFENKMSIPAWLQSVGRMHPMFVHFPIVILLLAMGMEFFRFNSDFHKQSFYQDFTTALLLAGALFAAITVILGLLLSNESAYAGSSVEWHKWMGISIVSIASLVYWNRNAGWYKAPIAKSVAVIAIVCVIISGYLGAGITHGDDFISTPLLAFRAAEKVPVDKAVIYTDVVQPIFRSKCMNCHNSGKAKGGLILDNPEDILKGGKIGKLFIAGNADSSLIIERIHLPEEEKKHMPLTGKPQLSKDEMDIIYLWIQSGADFKKKLTALPGNDSLRLIASKFLAPPEEEKYDFEAADEKTIKALSNNYRVVYPVAKESPALVVDFYNKNQFSSKTLADLIAVKKQIIELNLNKMPVNDADLKLVAQFENLRILSLNFTNITGSGLAQLLSLKYLKSLSLSGTKMDLSSVLALGNIKSLRKVILWNTGLKGEEIGLLQKKNKNIRFIEGFKQDAPMQLNAPVLITTNSVFADTIHVLLKHPIPGVEIHYTLDGTNPDSIHAPVFNKDVVIDKTAYFKARAFKTTWLGSDSVEQHFYKSIYKPDSIRFISFPADSYKGDGTATLSDHITGDLNFSDGKWLGFKKDMDLLLKFIKPVKLHSVCLHMLKNSGSDIYPPERVEVWGGNYKTHLKLLQTIKPVAAVKGDIPSIFLEDCKFPAARVNYIKIIAISVKKSPKWGNSPNKPGWVFTDEVLLN